MDSRFLPHFFHPDAMVLSKSAAASGIVFPPRGLFGNALAAGIFTDIKPENRMLKSEFAEKTIAALIDAPLLRNCGRPGEHANFGLHQRVDKHTAEQSGLSQEWEHYGQARAHDMTAHLLKRARTESDKHWNTYAKQFRDIWEDLLLPKITYGFAISKLHPELEAAVHWDLLNIVMHDSFIAYRPPAFYPRLAAVYLAGHFPCGVADRDITHTDSITLLVY